MALAGGSQVQGWELETVELTESYAALELDSHMGLLPVAPVLSNESCIVLAVPIYIVVIIASRCSHVRVSYWIWLRTLRALTHRFRKGGLWGGRRGTNFGHRPPQTKHDVVEAAIQG